MRASILFSVLILATQSGAQLNPPLLTPPDPAQMGVRIPRTLEKLKNRQPLKIVYAGQSIIDGNNPWRLWLVDSLKNVYGYDQISQATVAIGGCASSCQLGNAPDALGGVYDRIPRMLQENPDLIIYYVYGWEDYDQAITRLLQGNPQLEILVLDDHVVPVPAETHGRVYGEYMRDHFLPWMCEKHGIALYNIYTPWKQYLEDHNLPVSHCLSDDVHLNTNGQILMADLVKRYFVDPAPVTTGPSVVSARAASRTRITITFDKPLDSTSAVLANNYTIDNDATVTGVLYGGDLSSVILSTTPLTTGSYTVAISNVYERTSTVAANTTASVPVGDIPVWDSRDIGKHGGPGSTVAGNGETSFTLTSRADNTWAYKNEFHYAYTTVYGDCEIVARLASMNGSHQNAMAGLAIRETPDYYARSMLIGLKNADGIVESFRRPHPRDTIASRRVAVGRSTPAWFKITRSGSTLTLAYSPDGASWTPSILMSVRMGEEITVGMFALAGNYGQQNSAVFDNVSVTSSSVPVAFSVPAPAAVPQPGSAHLLSISPLEPPDASALLYDLVGRRITPRQQLPGGVRVVAPTPVLRVQH